MYESRADHGPPSRVGLAPHGPAAVMASESGDEQSVLEALTFDLTETEARVLWSC